MSDKDQPAAADCPVLDGGALPTFRLPDRSFRVALKSQIVAAMEEYAEKAKLRK